MIDTALKELGNIQSWATALQSDVDHITAALRTRIQTSRWGVPNDDKDKEEEE